jgi:disulfide bond formation protein DsbB
MIYQEIEEPPSRAAAWLNYAALLLTMMVAAGILTAALYFQYSAAELPCPLCLLQRVALFGVCFGVMLSFRHGFSHAHSGISMIFSVFLLIVAARQTLLDIYPRPGHAYIGEAVLGLHMPVWSVLIAAALLTGQAIQLALFGDNRQVLETPARAFPVLAGLAGLVGVYVIGLCAANLVSVVLQCGLDQCHTFGYRLLLPASATP